MRAKAHELQRLIVRQPVDQHEIGANVAVAVVTPVAGQGVIVVTRLERPVCNQSVQHRGKIRHEGRAVLPFHLPLIVALELPGALNRPH